MFIFRLKKRKKNRGKIEFQLSIIPIYNMQDSAHPIRPLYGGAIQAILNPLFDDVSRLREVPDHQEVFLYTSHDISLIVELLDLDKVHADDTALRYHFEELARVNESFQSTILSEKLLMDDSFMPFIGPGFTRMALIGKQYVKKYHSPDAPVDEVYIILVLIRLRNVGTDLLITLNIPVKDEIRALPLDTWFSDVNILTVGSPLESTYDTVYTALPPINLFREVLHTFKINDWSLFGN